MRIVKTQREVGQFFKVTQSAIAIWNRRGMPHTEDGQYDLDEIQAWRAKNIKASNNYPMQKEIEKNVAQLRMNTDMGVPAIAEALNVNMRTVSSITKKIDKYRPDLESFKNTKADLFAVEQIEYLDHITDKKLKKTGARDLAAMAKMAWEKERTERGESTDNVAVIVKHINALKALEEDAEQGRDKRTTED